MVGQWSRISLSAIAEESSERRWGRPPWGSARLHRRDRANRFAPGTAADRRVHGWTIRGVGAWCGAGVDAPRDAVLLLPDETKWSFIRPAATHPGSYELFWLAAMRSSGNPRARDEGRARPNPCARIGWDTMRQSSRPRDERLPWHGARRVTAAGVAGEGRWSAKRVPRFGRFVRFRAVVVWREAKLLRARRRGPRLTWT
jgi:hypothetical protein